MSHADYEFLHPDCPVCGSGDVEVTSEGLWSGADDKGPTGGSVFSGVCRACYAKLHKRTLRDGETPWQSY